MQQIHLQGQFEDQPGKVIPGGYTAIAIVKDALPGGIGARFDGQLQHVRRGPCQVSRPRRAPGLITDNTELRALPSQPQHVHDEITAVSRVNSGSTQDQVAAVTGTNSPLPRQLALAIDPQGADQIPFPVRTVRTAGENIVRRIVQQETIVALAPATQGCRQLCIDLECSTVLTFRLIHRSIGRCVDHYIWRLPVEQTLNLVQVGQVHFKGIVATGISINGNNPAQTGQASLQFLAKLTGSACEQDIHACMRGRFSSATSLSNGAFLSLSDRLCALIGHSIAMSGSFQAMTESQGA